MRTYSIKGIKGLTEGTKGIVSPRLFVRRWLAAAMMLVAALLALFFVANAIAVNELMENVTRLEAERNAERRQNEGLRSELTRLTSVDRIVEAAAAIGMVEPERPPRTIGQSD